jgi:hypothetical protein
MKPITVAFVLAATVTLSQEELQSVINYYIAQYATSQASARAKPAIDKINKAFSAEKPNDSLTDNPSAK